MGGTGELGGRLLAISDLHVSMPDNRPVVEALRPTEPGDWLIVAGDVSEIFADIEWAIALLADRFERVIWVPGNHELWTHNRDPHGLRGVARYEALVAMCRRHGVLTPEDPYPVWRGAGGPATIAPLFLLYDYSFLPAGAADKAAALTLAYDTGVVCTDEYLLHPDPHPSREAWCAARLTDTERRLAGRDPTLPSVLINHWPLTRQPTDILHYPQFAQWCGTAATADWHRRYAATAVVYGHLHIPRTTWADGVRFEEVSVGYPREWRRHGLRHDLLRQVLPAPQGPLPEFPAFPNRHK